MDTILEHEGKYPDAKALIIGCGPTTNQLKEKHLDRFDVVIGVNMSFVRFDPYLTYHLVIEDTPWGLIKQMNKMNLRNDLPRLVSGNIIEKYPQHLNLIPANRVHDNPDIKHYNNGLMWSFGYRADSSVALQALHWACILGCTDIRFIGTELCWRKNFNDHFYGDEGYRDKNETNKLIFPASGYTFCTEKLKGGVESFQTFIDTADFIDRVIVKLCEPAGIKVYDYSNGLISKAQKVKL